MSKIKYDISKKNTMAIKVSAIYFIALFILLKTYEKLSGMLLNDGDSIEMAKLFHNLIFLVTGSLVIYYLVLKFNRKQEEVLKKLEISEASKKAFIDSLPFSIFQKDLNYIYRSTNEHYDEYMKMLNVKVIGHTDYEIFDKDIADEYRRQDEKVLRDKETVAFSEDKVSIDGSRIFNVVKTPFFEKGEVKGIVGVIVDITKSRRRGEEFRKLYAAIEKNISAVVITKLNGEIEYVNKAYENISGYTKLELLGENVKSFRAGDKEDKDYSEMWETVESGDTWKGETKNRRKDGSIYWQRNYIMPVMDEKNVVKSVIAFKEDVSHEKETESIVNELEKFKEKVIDNKNVWISGANENDEIVLWNPACEKITGYSSEEVMGKRNLLIDLLHESNDYSNVVRLGNLKEVNSPLKLSIITKQGEKKYISLAVKNVFIRGNNTSLNLFMGADITKEVIVELELKKINSELENRVRLRTEELFKTNEFLEQSMGELEEQQAELTILNDQLERSLEKLKKTQEQLITSEKLAALGELVAGVAHEINTPLGIGVTLSTFIKEKHKGLKYEFLNNQLKKASMKEYVDSIDEAIDLMVINLYRASELVTSFKQVATDQSTLEIRKFNVASYINEILMSLHPRLKKTNHKVEVSCDNDFEMIGYPGAISQVITNLVMNSLIHGFENMENGLIKIGIRVDEGIIYFKYTDNGKGIKKEELENVFKPFYTTKKNSGSTGLGMHIINNVVVQILNGKIELKSNVNEGIEMLIEFPLLKYDEINK